MGQPHKHAALIKAWADGAIIEGRSSESNCWRQIDTPIWDKEWEYRVKPKPKVKKWRWVAQNRKTGALDISWDVLSEDEANKLILIVRGWVPIQKIDSTMIEVEE